MHFLLLFAILLAACSAGVPSESDARSVYENKKLKQIKEGILKVEAFKKVNGQKMNIFGVEGYEVEYRALVIYLKGILPECADKKNKSLKCIGARREGVIRHPGESRSFKGKIHFEKTEKGWRGEDGKIY